MVVRLLDPRHASAPGGGTEGGRDDQVAGRSRSILPSEAAACTDGSLVVVVRTPAGRYRRRVFLTLAAAERARDRAQDAGHDAEIVLCRLTPMGVIS